MPYVVETHCGQEALRAAVKENRLKFTEEDLSEATRLIWSASSFSDPGEDWNLFTLENGDEIVAFQRVEGY